MNKIISIFSGIDCLGIGFAEDFDMVLAVEKEKNACKTLFMNKDNYHSNLEIMNQDIFSIPDDTIEKYKGACGIIGGPPCQAFSSARGSFNPEDDRIKGLSEYVRWVRIIKPKFFMFENTNGLMEKGKVQIFEYFVNELEKLDYDVKFKVLNAHDYGSVQNRKRIIAIGFKKELNAVYEFPKPVETKKYVKDIILKEDEVLGECAKYSEARKRIISYVPEGGNWRDLPTEELKEEALGGNYTKRKGGMTGVYKRLDRNEYCPTLTTNPCQRNTMACHPLKDRPLSVEEYKRAQGIPNNYEIYGSTSQKYKFIGNGVPVELASAIAKSIYETISKTENKEKQENPKIINTLFDILEDTEYATNI